MLTRGSFLTPRGGVAVAITDMCEAIVPKIWKESRREIQFTGVQAIWETRSRSWWKHVLEHPSWQPAMHAVLGRTLLSRATR